VTDDGRFLHDVVFTHELFKLSTYGHTQEPGSVVFKLEVLVGKVPGTVY
jgi:hypothetical protein